MKKSTTKDSSTQHMRLQVKLTGFICLRTLVLCIITHFQISCPPSLGFLIYCFLFLLLRLYLAHLKEVHQNHFQLIPENVRKRKRHIFLIIEMLTSKSLFYSTNTRLKAMFIQREMILNFFSYKSKVKNLNIYREYVYK